MEKQCCTEENQNHLGFSSVFAFKQAKEHILIHLQPLKMLNKTNFCVHFRVTVQIFKGPAPKERDNIKVM